MAKSPHLGSYSYKPERNREQAVSSLCDLIDSQPLKAIKEAMPTAELFLVGGSVRDAFFKTSSTDLDLATNLSPQQVLQACSAANMRVVETGISHGTVLVVSHNSHIEITTFRKPSDRNQHDTADSIETDLRGRDFTINALAFSMHDRTLIDPFNGIDDLMNGILRGVDDPAARFKEDSLRILRMIRFGDGSGRTIDNATLSAAAECIGMLASVSVERIKTELQQIILTPYPAYCIRRLEKLGGLQYTIPELLPAVGFEQNRYHIHDVFEHTMSVLERTPPDPILRWAAIFHDIGKPHTLSVDERGERHFYSHEVVSYSKSTERMRTLRFSSEEVRKIGSIVRYHMRPLQCGPAGVRRILRDLGGEYELWRRFKEADASPTIPQAEFLKDAAVFDSMVSQEQARAKNPAYGKLAVGGDDLLNLGVPEGPQVGAILKHLQELVLDSPKKNTRRTLLRAAKRLLESKIAGTE